MIVSNALSSISLVCCGVYACFVRGGTVHAIIRLTKSFRQKFVELAEERGEIYDEKLNFTHCLNYTHELN